MVKAKSATPLMYLLDVTPYIMEPTHTLVLEMRVDTKGNIFRDWV